MFKCTLEPDMIRKMNSLLKHKNNLSLFNQFDTTDMTQEDILYFEQMGLINSNGIQTEDMKPKFELISNPYAVVSVVFSGGVSVYEHNICYDDTYENWVSVSVTPEGITIDDVTDQTNIIKALSDFVGRSNLKSVNISKTFSIEEALVMATMLDMERKSILRAFVDEMPITQNSYNTNMIWRLINSTSASIQWFVSIISDVIGEHRTLSQQQVQNALEQLSNRGLLNQNKGQYQLSDEFSVLSSRMVIVDNVLSVISSRMDNYTDTISSGFTCVQSGVHDLLLLDYNGSEIIFKTITSVKLIEYLENILDSKAYYTR